MRAIGGHSLVENDVGRTRYGPIAQKRADDVTARRTADEHTTSRISQIDPRLEDISTRLTPPTSSSSRK
jgi:hypothetical protein